MGGWRRKRPKYQLVRWPGTPASVSTADTAIIVTTLSSISTTVLLHKEGSWNNDMMDAMFTDMIPLGEWDPNVQQLLRAVETRSLDEMSTLINSGVPVNGHSGSFHETALHLAAQQKWTLGVKYLLSVGASVYTKNQFSQTPLHYAAAGQAVECVKLLLDSGRLGALEHRDMRGHTPLHDAAAAGDVETIKVLLKEGALVNCQDSNKETPLHKAAKSRVFPAMVTLLNNGADMGAKDINNESVLMYILRHIPGGMEIIFDHCLITNTHIMSSKTLEVSFDFSPFAHPTQRNQVKHMGTFIRLANPKLLSHPLCETFLLVKWRSVRAWFLFGVIVFVLYAGVMTGLTINQFDAMANNATLGKFDLSNETIKYYQKIIKCPDEEYSPSECADNECTPPPKCPDNAWIYPAPPGVVTTFKAIVMILTVIFILHELLTLWQNTMAWFRSISSIINMLIYVLVMLVIIPEVSEWQHHCAVYLVLFLWIQVMILIGRFPACGIYVLMITRVAMVFLRIFIIYIFILFAFCLSFYIAVPKYNLVFSNPIYSFIKVLTMMIGELDFGEEFIKDMNTLPFTMHAIFITFTIFVSIILSNLLVALAVNDVQGLRNSAHLERLKKQTELVFHMEKSFDEFYKLAKRLRLSGLLRFFEWCSNNCRHDCKTTKVFLLPYHTQKSKKLFTMETMEKKRFFEQNLPKHLLANVWERLRMKEKTIQDRRCSTKSNARNTWSKMTKTSNSEDMKYNLKNLEANIIEAMSFKMEKTAQVSTELSQRLDQIEKKLETITSVLLQGRLKELKPSDEEGDSNTSENVSTA